MESINKNKKDLLEEIEELKRQLEEAEETIEAIRTGQIDALIVHGVSGHQLYTLKTADQTYRVFIEKMTEGAVTLNRDGMVMYCNSKFASMVNLPSSEILGFSFSDFVTATTKSDFEGLFERSWTADVKGEILLENKERPTPVQLSLTTLELDEGVSLSVILTDLTLQKKTQEQLSAYNRQLQQTNAALEDSNHDLQQFASVASHDLQEPLRKIQIFSNLMRERFTGSMGEEQETYLQKIIDSARRMKTLILDILNYSGLSSGSNEDDCIDLNVLINDVLVDFELIIQEKGAVITVDELPCITIKKGQLRQVFQNIISNALKFTRKEVVPQIYISSKRLLEKSLESAVSPDGPYCLIAIRDNGIGFNEQYTENIFELFERLHPKDKYEGTGIGLAIAKKIVEKYNGSIHVKSKEGDGSEFLIMLPIEPES